MCSTPFNRGILPTSTPIPPHGDSGYFSSCDKLPLDKVLCSLSPIKEISNFKRVTNLVEFTRFQVFESPCIHFDEKHFNHNAIARELDFSNSADFLRGNSCSDYACEFEDGDYAFKNSFPSFHMQDLSGEQDKAISERKFVDSKRQCCDDFHQNAKLVNVYNRLNNISPVNKIASSLYADCNKDQFVNFKTAFKLRKKVDFLEEFQKKNLYSIASLLLSLLSAEDLCRMSCVNKNWNQIIQHCNHANCRRKAFLKEKYSQKENHYHSTSSEIDLEDMYSSRDNEYKTALFNKCNFAATPKQPLKKQHVTKFNSFFKEGTALVNSILLKCPRCKYAAKSQIGSAYLCTECNYAFCQRCLGPYLKGHTCPTSKKVSIVIGSKESKQNLKRL